MPAPEARGTAATLCVDDEPNILAALRRLFRGKGYRVLTAESGVAVGAAIPLGARVLALASDYDNLQLGALVQRRLRPSEAKQIVYDSSGRRYDPEVVTAFRALMDGDPVERVRDVAVLSSELVPGMVLSRDLVGRDGLMRLSAEHVLDERLIQQVLGFEAKNEGRLSIHIWPRGAT